MDAELEKVEVVTREKWKILVEEDLKSICKDRRVELVWTKGTSPAAVITSDKRRTHLAAHGIWFLGSEKKDVAKLILGPGR